MPEARPLLCSSLSTCVYEGVLNKDVLVDDGSQLWRKVQEIALRCHLRGASLYQGRRWQSHDLQWESARRKDDLRSVVFGEYSRAVYEVTPDHIHVVGAPPRSM